MEQGFEQKRNISDIEKTANYEGNHALLLHERITNPIIHQRLVDNFYEHLSTLKASAFLQANSYTRTPRQAERARKDFLKTVTKEKIAEDLDKLIERVFSETRIDYDKNERQPASSRGLGDYGTVNPFGTWIENDEPFSIQQLSAMEAHEKGHGIRMFNGESDFTRRLAQGFDFSQVSQETKDAYVRILEKYQGKSLSEEAKREKLDYFKSPHEIFERMSQLKNYFGMKGDEVFTKEHLDYARKHYTEDIGMPSQIAPFLEAITPETEGKFIELMNTLGI